MKSNSEMYVCLQWGGGAHYFKSGVLDFIDFLTSCNLLTFHLNFPTLAKTTNSLPSCLNVADYFFMIQ